MTPLARKLADRIRVAGPITIADYMASCLGDPEHGYYTTREPFGTAGDFVTAPEVSQMFGELIGIWAVAVWEAMGAPSRFAFAELGPGRGTLMADALRAARLRPGFGGAAEVHLVETSPRLTDIQRATLAASGTTPTWHAEASGLPHLPMIVVANEFFDALPVRQLIMTADGWAERVIGLDAAGQLSFGLLPTSGLANRSSAPEGSIVEISPGAAAVMQALSEGLAAEGGACLAIDYGYEGPAVGDTLQALHNGQAADPLGAPGEADLTAHVDFGALAAAARRGGARTASITSQGAFLHRLGLGARTETLSRGKDDATRAALEIAASRLAAPDQMGTLFKVLGVASPGLALPALDDDPTRSL